MKRWQDRGEVPDSDEDDLSLGTDSQSPERARKRPRIDGDHESQRDVNRPSSIDTPPREPSSDHETEAKEDAGEPKERASNTGAVRSQKDTFAPSYLDEVTEPDWATRNAAVIYGRRGRLPRRDTTRTRGLVPVITQVEQDAVAVQVFDKSAGVAKLSNATVSGDPQYANAGATVNAPAGQSSPAALGMTGQQDVPSRASSPLSDLSEPPDFLPLTNGTFSQDDNGGQAHELPMADSTELAQSTDIQDTIDMLSPGPVRRSLRTRQEKQLHPYMYDNALYQRQCRERGLRPVRLMEQMLRETQDVPLGSDGPHRQSGIQPSSSALDQSSDRGLSGSVAESRSITDQGGDDSLRDPAHDQSDDELPDIEALTSDKAATRLLPALKRRKLGHNSTMQPNKGGTAGPLSPSSTPDSNDAPGLPKPSHKFRLPRGLSPIPLPTPSVSSNIKQHAHFNVQDTSTSSSPPRTARRSAFPRPILVSDDSSTESEAVSEIDGRSLRLERKRIRGVLPASWLKIDQKAQKSRQLSSDSESGDYAPSPQPTVPQKGVARRVDRRTALPRRAFSEMLSSDDGEAREASASVGAKSPHLSKSRRQSLHPTDDIGAVDDMEVDWVDPMLAGASRAHKKPEDDRDRQPRITESLHRVQNDRPDFSEERNGLRQMRSSNLTNSKQGASRTKRNPQKRQKPPPLSILDAPISPVHITGKLPQFVRLASRRARQCENRARASPSSKSIRLATNGDTENAMETLYSWQKGEIPQRQPASRPSHAITARNTGGFSKGGGRTPLVETSANQRQSRLPRVSGKSPALASDVLNSLMSGVEYHTSPATERDNNSSRKDKTSAKTWVSRGKTNIVRYRNAQLESPATTAHLQDRPAAFQQRIDCLTEAVVRNTDVRATRDLPLSRFLHSAGPGLSIPMEKPSGFADTTGPHQDAGMSCAERERFKRPAPHRPRKDRSSRIHIESREYRQPSEPLPDFGQMHHSDELSSEGSEPIIRELGPFGARYAIDFDIRPLPRGTFFHESTFVGSGDLAASLVTNTRDMNIATGTIRIYVNGIGHDLGAWTDEVSTVIGEVVESTAVAVRTLITLPSDERVTESPAVISNVDHMLRSVIRYVSRCLYFYDPVDPAICSGRLCQLVGDLLDLTDDTAVWQPLLCRLKTRILRYALVVSRQILGLCSDAVPLADIRKTAESRMLAAASRLALRLVPHRLEDLRYAYEDCRIPARQELGIRDDDSAITSLVTLQHTLRQQHATRSIFWDVLGNALGSERSLSHSVVSLDKLWYDLFTILPSLAFDAQGIITSRVGQPEVEWTLPKRLVGMSLERYPATSKVRGSTINAYIRAVFTRCYRLIVTWKWTKAEAILGIMYDFFARRNLSLLNNEESRGSPGFLNDLANIQAEDLQVETDDSSFHIFLKALTSTLRGLRDSQRYTDKKIGGIAWRFIPNHARVYRKDAEVRQDDLEALRNHCDLLCTLYFASPPGHRLRVDLLRNLVDHATSHREACRISVRAWSNLASYQTSTSEPATALEPLVDWFKEMVQTTVTQYRLARTEAEQQYASARAKGDSALTTELLEQTVAGNQRQIAATLVDLLAAVRRAVGSSSSLQVATSIFARAEPWTALDSFNLSERRLKSVFLEALNLLKELRAVHKRFATESESQPVSDDSQDYGDFSALQEFAGTQTCSQAPIAAEMTLLIQEPLSHLLSNAFGSEIAPDDTLLTELLDLWIAQITQLVRDHMRSWSNFVDDYTTSAWYRLRETEQWRKFTPYFLARIISTDPEAFAQLKHTMLAAWLTSLVERECALKYQHLLTAAILNAPPGDPLVDNLPFSTSSSTGMFELSLQDLRQRRLGLLSSVLSNMRAMYDYAVYEKPQALPELRRIFSDLLRKLMHAMKVNYEELQLGSNSTQAQTGMQGNYVEFVHQVVSFLQEYTTEICPVDRFFTDSSAFPLPSTDPGYVVGRLRSYAPKLADSKTRKQLAVFVHAVSERAAIDGKQNHLIEQLSDATSGQVEHGDASAPSLRDVLLEAIFPAYISNAISDSCAWVLALPILEASAKCCVQLMYDTSFDQTDSIDAALAQVSAILQSVHKAIAPALLHQGLLGLSHVQKVLKSMLQVCQSTLTFVYHVHRTTAQAGTAITTLRALRARFADVQTCLSASSEFPTMDSEIAVPEPAAEYWLDAREFAAKQLRESMAKDWYAIDGKYFLRRGNTSKEVLVSLADGEGERDGLLGALRDFQQSFGRQQRVRMRRRGHVVGSALGLGDLVV